MAHFYRNTPGRMPNYASLIYRQAMVSFSWILILVVLSYLAVPSTAANNTTETEAAENVTVANDLHTEPFNATTNSTAGDGGEGKANKDVESSGTKILVIVILVALFLLVGLSLLVWIFGRRRFNQMLSKEKTMQMQMTSARNAGVYQDLTVSLPSEDAEKPASPEHERLKPAEDV